MGERSSRSDHVGDLGPSAGSVEKDIEVLTIGRVSVDLYAEQLGEPMRNVTSFKKSIGGTATNVAVAAARLGRRVGLVTKVGDDQFGDYVRHALEHTFGVDSRFIATDPDLQTPLAFAELNPPEEPSIIFYREPRAPDQNIEVSDVDADVVRDVPIFWMPASRFSDEHSAATVTSVAPSAGLREEIAGGVLSGGLASALISAPLRAPS